MSDEWELKENDSLGPIKLNSNISKYTNRYRIEKLEDPTDTTGWTSYEINADGIVIDVDELSGLIVSVTARKKCLLDGKNMIGRSLSELNELLPEQTVEKGDAVEYEDGDLRTPYDYENSGLQVWVSNGSIMSITCLTYSDCD